MAAQIPTITLDSTLNQTRAALSWMRTLAYRHKAEPEIVSLARAIVADIDNEDRVAMAEAVRSWIHDNITYRSDPSEVQYIQDVPVTLAERSGNCDCMAVLASCLLEALGHKTYALGVIWTGEREATHAVIYDHDAGVIVDPVTASPCHAWPPAPYVAASFVTGA